MGIKTIVNNKTAINIPTRSLFEISALLNPPVKISVIAYAFCGFNNIKKEIKEPVNKFKDKPIKIQNARLSNKEPHKKILYIIQEKPLMTIGKNSFITDAIEKSGNKSITADIDSYYPIIQEEYAIKKAPDIVIMGHYSNNTQRIKKLFPNSKIIVLTHEQSDIIDRPSVRIYESVAFFANLQ